MTEPETTTPDPSTPASPPAVPDRSGWLAAVDRVRETNAWIVKAFSGLAVLLVGSGPLLVKLGDLPSWPRALVAAVAGLAALAGVGWVIHEASRVMLPEWADLSQLIDATDGPLADLKKHVETATGGPALYLGDEATKVEELLAGIVAWRRTVHDLSVRSAQGADPPSAQAKLPGAIAAAKAHLAALYGRMEELLEQAVYFEVRDTFKRALPRMFTGAAVVAVGTAVYLGALGIDLAESEEKAEEESATAGTATPGMLVWADKAEPGARPVTAVREELGLAATGCNRLPVLTSGAGTERDPWNITTIQLGPCDVSPRTFILDQRYGQVVVTTPLTYTLDP